METNEMQIVPVSRDCWRTPGHPSRSSASGPAPPPPRPLPQGLEVSDAPSPGPELLKDTLSTPSWSGEGEEPGSHCELEEAIHTCRPGVPPGRTLICSGSAPARAVCGCWLPGLPPLTPLYPVLVHAQRPLPALPPGPG